MLSGGEQQRVAVSRALVMQPSLLLADEPTGDLDEATADALHQLLRTMHAEFGLTAIIATHNPRLAAQCDRTLRLEAGKFSRASVQMLRFTRAPQHFHLDRGQQRHRAAAIVGAVHHRAIEVVLLRRSRRRFPNTHPCTVPSAFTRAATAFQPRLMIGSYVDAIDPAETHAARHRRDRHRRHGQLAITRRLVDDLPPTAVVRLELRQRRDVLAIDLEHARRDRSSLAGRCVSASVTPSSAKPLPRPHACGPSTA